MEDVSNTWLGLFGQQPQHQTDEDVRAQTQRIAMERALLQSGGSPTDLPWTTYDQPPSSDGGLVTDVPEQDRPAQDLSQPPQYASRQEWELAQGPPPQRAQPAGAADDFYQAILEMAANGGTGPIPRYDLPEIRTGEEPRYEFPEDATGERARNEPTGRRTRRGAGPSVLLTGQSQQHVRDRARREWLTAAREYGTQRNDFNRAFGAALAQAALLQAQGVTPTMAQLAARQLVPTAMGIYTPTEVQR